MEKCQMATETLIKAELFKVLEILKKVQF